MKSAVIIDIMMLFHPQTSLYLLSQKAVIIDIMKSVGEIASKIWPVVQYLTHLGKILTVIDTWVIGCNLLGCTLVPSMKSVGEIASEI